jgi:hypothetical protein
MANFRIEQRRCISLSGREFQDEKTGEIRLYGNAKFKLLVHLEIWVGAIFPTGQKNSARIGPVTLFFKSHRPLLPTVLFFLGRREKEAPTLNFQIA